MDYALKNDLYKKAKKILNQDNIVHIWTGWDDPMYEGSEINSIESLKKVFKYAYNMGWPIIRVE